MNKDVLHRLAYAIWLKIYRKQMLPFDEIWHHRKGKYLEYLQ